MIKAYKYSFVLVFLYLACFVHLLEGLTAQNCHWRMC